MVLRGMPMDNTNSALKRTRDMCLGQPGSIGITNAKAEMEQKSSVFI